MLTGIATKSEINQTANSLGMYLYDELNTTGVKISNHTIDLKADKVTFSNSAGTVHDKIWIDPTDGTLHAVNGQFSGTVTANLVYTPMKILPSSAYAIDISNEAYSFYISQYGADADVTLPSAQGLGGLQFSFFYYPGTRMSPGYLKIEPQSGEYIISVNNSEPAFYTHVSIGMFTMVKMISNGDNWIVIEGNSAVTSIS